MTMRWLWWLSFILYPYLNRVIGRERLPGGSCVFAVNHEGPMDPLFLLMAARRPLYFLATNTLAERGRGELWWWHGLWVFLLGRSIPTGLGVIDRCVTALHARKSLSIFPEGRIHPKSPDHRIHSGIAVIAHKAQVPIVPIHIKGSGGIWPITNTPIRLWRLRSVRVVIGEPIQPPSPGTVLTKNDYRFISANIMQEIKKL